MLGVYTLVLTLALPAAARLRPGAVVGALVFAGASLACGLAESIGVLLAMRGVQAVGGAALLVGAFALLDAGGAGRRAWTATAIFGFAAGPALGGALTQALDWRAIFLVQAPLAAAAAFAAWRAVPAARRPRRRARPSGRPRPSHHARPSGRPRPSHHARPSGRPQPPRERPSRGRSGRPWRSRWSPPPSSACSSCSCCCW